MEMDDESGAARGIGFQPVMCMAGPWVNLGNVTRPVSPQRQQGISK